MSNYKAIRGSILLVITAMIWGAAFVAQSVGLDYMQPITFNCIRCIIGGAVLLPVVAIFGGKKRRDKARAVEPLPAGSDPSVGAVVAEPGARKSASAGKSTVAPTGTSTENPTGAPALNLSAALAVSPAAEFADLPEGGGAATAALEYAPRGAVSARAQISEKQARRDLWLGGILCGAVLFVASTLQQIGLVYTTAGKAGFITALYIVIVPAMGLFFGRRAPFTVWAGAAIAVLGLYMLIVKENFSLGIGDLLILLCAFCFSAHIMLISYFSPRCDGIAMSCIQFFVAGLLGIAPMLIFESPSVSAMFAGWLPILYAGVMSCGVAYTLQIIAQRDVNETVASLLMSLESVFAALTGRLMLKERFTVPELIGCVLIFAAVLLAQIPPTRIRLPKRKK